MASSRRWAWVMMLGVAAAALTASNAKAAEGAAKPEGKKLLYHVVSFRFKEGTTAEQIKKVTDAFEALKGKIPGIVSLEWGTNNSPEKLNKGFTHCFILTFETEKARDEYLPHPEHKAFGKVLGPVLGDVFVIDFWAQGA